MEDPSRDRSVYQRRRDTGVPTLCRPGPPLFVGRNRQLRSMAAARQRARLGQFQLVVIEGGAGRGKTALLERAAEAAVAEGFAVAVGSCWPYGGAPPGWPWLDLLRRLPTAGPPAGRSRPAAVPGADRIAHFESVLDRLAAATVHRPLFLVLDDVHLADADTLLLTLFLSRSGRALPAVLVVSLRPPDPAAPAAALLHDLTDAGLRVTLPPFTLDDARRALAAVAPDDAVGGAAALALCRSAGEDLCQAGDGAAAADLLGHAIDRFAVHGTGPSWLYREAGRAALACGRLTDARVWFGRGVESATAEADRTALAECALGLGGIWLNEHRHTAERARILALQRQALDALPAGTEVLRARLVMRLAAEAVYDGGALEPVHRALARVRAVGDPAALAEALSLAHHAMLGPAEIGTRLALAEELLAVATEARHPLLVLMGLLWRTVDLYELADHRAERSLAELRSQAEVVACDGVRFIVAAIDVMRLIRAGRLDEAEAAAGRCWEVGRAAGDADADGYLGAHLLVIRWLQERDGELAAALDQLLASPTTSPDDRAFLAMAASVAARAGDRDRARAILADLGPEGPGGVPPSSNWTTAMVALAETARALDDGPLAQAVHRGLAPHAAMAVLPSLAVSCLGSVEHWLGVTARTAGDRAEAIDHLERAVSANRRLGNQPMAALSQAELALALADGGDPAARARAAGLLAEAVAGARAAGLTGRAERWDRHAAGLVELASAPMTIDRGVTGWRVACSGRAVELGDLVGLGYLRELIRRPGEEVPATELCRAAVTGPAQPVLDRRAADAYRRRLAELDEAIDDAVAGCSTGREELLRLEREALVDELGRSMGLGGRSRAFAEPGERARTAVSKAIKRAIDAVEQADPLLGITLRESVTTGATCRYRPATGPAGTSTAALAGQGWEGVGSWA